VYASSEMSGSDRHDQRKSRNFATREPYTTARAVISEILARFTLWIPSSGRDDTFARNYPILTAAWQAPESTDRPLTSDTVLRAACNFERRLAARAATYR
jgi:hypothetical protein